MLLQSQLYVFMSAKNENDLFRKSTFTMADPDRNPLKKQLSKSSLEKSLQMISTPQQAPITIYPGPKAGMATMSKVRIFVGNLRNG